MNYLWLYLKLHKIQGVSKKTGILKSALLLGLLWPKPNFLWYFQYPVGYNAFLGDNRIYMTSLINIFYPHLSETSKCQLLKQLRANSRKNRRFRTERLLNLLSKFEIHMEVSGPQNFFLYDWKLDCESWMMVLFLKLKISKVWLRC